MNDENEPRAGSNHDEFWKLTLENIVYKQTLEALEELANEAIALIKSARPSTPMATECICGEINARHCPIHNEPEKVTDMVTRCEHNRADYRTCPHCNGIGSASHMGFFNDEGINK